MSEETNEQGGEQVGDGEQTNAAAAATAATDQPVDAGAPTDTKPDAVASADAASSTATPQDQVQAAAPKWQPMELVDGVAVPVVPAPAGVHLLDRARALEELAKGETAELIEEGIQAFKDIEGRTMRVVHRLGQLFKQEV